MPFLPVASSAIAVLGCTPAPRACHMWRMQLTRDLGSTPKRPTLLLIRLSPHACSAAVASYKLSTTRVRHAKHFENTS